MTFQEMLDHIHKNLKQGCFSDIVEQTGVSPTAVWKWRNEPPDRPSLVVFCRLARYYGLNPTINQLENLF